jgi:hypothetical protein
MCVSAGVRTTRAPRRHRTLAVRVARDMGLEESLLGEALDYHSMAEPHG